MASLKYIDEFRDGKLAPEICREIGRVTGGRKITLMEVCGTHTMAVHRHGLRRLLPENIQLLSGPGCPVCVTPNEYIDRAVAYACLPVRQARLPDAIVATFGDMMRVPGSSSSLEMAKMHGGDVRVVYSALDAVEIAKVNPSRSVIFLGVGFETTAPTVAATVLEAKKRGLKNFFVSSAHKVMPPAMKALVDAKAVRIDGFICPAHVSTIIGSRPYEFLARQYHKACVIAGFEPLDILQGILMLVRQVVQGEPQVEIQYRRVAKPEGNPKALALLAEVFEPVDANWRGIGWIPASGLRLKDAYRSFDAEANFPVEVEPTVEPSGCICGFVLQGIRTPPECPLFGNSCTPESPIGACMVSSEGTCAAYYKYSRDE